MTSLSKQLETLRTATAGQLTVEKRHVSLLFDRQEAEKLDRETVFKIGSTGYAQLKKLDLTSFDDCDEFFEETVLNFQRTMINKAENQALDVKLERFIFKLSPYLLHFSCQQVLEWLIHRYQIHAYNAEFLMSAFLPFHDTNLYGRLLSIIEFNFATSKDWAFLQEFGKLQIPVPFRIIIKNALSSKHSLLSRISDHIDKALSIVGADFLETKSSHLFTFYAKVTLATLDQAKQADDGLISKIVPMLGNGLRSPIASFRNASMMIICQLCLTVKLAVPIRSSITKILMMKLRETTLTTSLSTLIVVCQLQGIESFSKKATLKLIRRADSLGIWTALQTLAEQTDLQAFLDPFWTSLFEIVQNEETSDEDREAAFKAIQKTGEVTRLSPDQARIYLTQLLAAYSTGLSVPKVMEKEVYNLCLRFSNEWEELLVEWTARDRETLDRFVKTFKLKNLVAIPTPELRKRHRRRSNSMRKSISESQEQHKQTAEERAQAMATASEFAKRVKFSGDPIRKAMEWITSEDIENLSWALEEMSVRPTYLSNQLEEDVEEFAVRAVKFAENQSPTVMEKIKSAMATANLPADFVVSMLSRHELNPSKAKKSKGKERLTPERAFEDQKDEEYWTRAKFVVETLTVSVKRSVNQKLYALLFDMLKESQSIQNGQLQYSVQHSLISLLIKMISSPGSYKITIKDLQIDPVVETMRSTASHHILRDSLKLLTAAVQLNPNSVTSHIMSVFTFMGSGLLRKDNDLTLDIIERTVEALFTAVVNNQSIQKPEIAQKLIAVTKVFAASAPDIPAHRRARMARAISRAVGVEGAWLVACVMIEGFCAKWQRNDPNKKNTEQDAFEDIAQELSASLDPAEQLSVVLDLVQFVVRLGGDQNPPKKSLQTDTAIFDRTKFTVQKLRHFRFVLVGIAVKILSNRQLLDKLSRTSDEELYETMLPIGQRLMTASVELDEFGAKESQMAEKSADPQTLRYWVALQGRSDTVSEKLRFLLPGGVAARLISNVLEDEKTESRMREKVLQLANVKLLTDGFFYTDSGINERHLSRLASVLNKWIAPHRSDPAMIELCKNATFSLKLVAKRIPKQSESAVLTETMEKAVELVNQWQSLDESMVGNVLFLAGELIRSHNMRCTMLSCEPLLQVCLSIIGEYLSASQKNKIQEEETSSQTKRQRVRQQSLSGRKLGSDTLLIASLSCLQRILDQFAAFVTSHLSTIFIAFARLSGKFPILEANPVPAKGTVQHRLSLINVALSNLEFRTLPGHFATAVREIAPEEKSLAALMSLLSSYFHRFNRRNTAAACGQLTTEIFLPALEFRNLERKPEKFENVANVEKNVAKTMLKMADLLVESELRAVFTSLVKWAEVGLSADSSRDARVRLVVLFHFANEFYNYFNHLAMPYFGTLLEMAPKVLRGCNATQNPDTSTLLLSGKRDTVEGLETDLLLTQVITFIGNCGRHKEFLAQDCVSSLALALVEELVNTRVAGHEARCVPHLADALYRMCDAAAESFPDVLNKIMLKTRNNRPKIRFRTLLVVEALLDKIGDGIAPHLPLIMPFLSELLEDENKNVEDQCDRVIRLLQKKFGENISEGF